MIFIGIGILVLLAALIVCALELRGMKDEISALRQELRGFDAGFTGWFRVLNGAAVDLNHQQEKTLEALKPLPEMAEGIKALLARESVSDALGRLEKRLADAPGVLSQDDESRLSREMQEGIENVLGYSLAQAREGKT